MSACSGANPQTYKTYRTSTPKFNEAGIGCAVGFDGFLLRNFDKQPTDLQNPHCSFMELSNEGGSPSVRIEVCSGARCGSGVAAVSSHRQLLIVDCFAFNFLHSTLALFPVNLPTDILRKRLCHTGDPGCPRAMYPTRISGPWKPCPSRNSPPSGGRLSYRTRFPIGYCRWPH